jgi:hypothetical protein
MSIFVHVSFQTDGVGRMVFGGLGLEPPLDCLAREKW